MAEGSGQRPRAATACSSIFAPNGSAPAWKVRPSWYLVSTDDRMIPPAAQRKMANRAGAITVETPGSHAIYVSNPGAVAKLIEQAAANVHRD